MICNNVLFCENALFTTKHALAGTIMVRACNQHPVDNLLQKTILIDFNGI